jgi:DNA-binding beta-propeller fold protein YncE
VSVLGASMVPARAAPQDGGHRVWVAHDGSPQFDWPGRPPVAVSPDGARVYVTGSLADNYLTRAYDAATGTVLWERWFGRGQLAVPVAIAVSPDGSTVFVTGARGSGDYSEDYGTVAYDAATGAQLWASIYVGPGGYIDQPRAMAVSPDSSIVFVTGYSWGLNRDYNTIAYRATDGATLWDARYDYPAPAGGEDEAFSIAVAGSTVLVTGNTLNGELGDLVAWTTIAYDGTSGAVLWADPTPETGLAIAVSPSGETAFAAGAELAAYSVADGTVLWTNPSIGVANFLGLSPDGATLYVASGSYTPGLVTSAYAAADGTLLWTSEVDGSFSCCFRLAVSPDGSKVFVAGTSYDESYNYDMVSFAYEASTGTRLWAARIKGPVDGDDEAGGIAASPDGSKVFVAGSVQVAEYDHSIVTVAYTA